MTDRKHAEAALHPGRTPGVGETKALHTAWAGMEWKGRCRKCQEALSGTPDELAKHQCEGTS